MNRFSLREMALLCAPVLLLAGAGWYFSTRKTPAPPKPLNLEFRLEKPTTLEAFRGADAALVTQLVDEKGTVQMSSADPFLELQTAKGTQTSWISRGYSGVWMQVWKGNYQRENRVRLPITAAAIPAGQLDFGIAVALPVAGYAAPPGVTQPTPVPPMRGKWRVDRSQIKPFQFQSLPRVPLIVLRSVKVTALAPGMVQGEATFDLAGAAMNAQTPTEFDLSGGTRVGNTTYGIGYDSDAHFDPKVATRRTLKWSLHGPTPAPASVKVVGDLSGRISADGRWPLAFRVEPVDFAKAKAGQKLKFQQWVALLPDSLAKP